jgi:hypothetical protein
MKPCWRPFHRTERKAAALVSLVMTRPVPPCVEAPARLPQPWRAGESLRDPCKRQSLRGPEQGAQQLRSHARQYSHQVLLLEKVRDLFGNRWLPPLMPEAQAIFFRRRHEHPSYRVRSSISLEGISWTKPAGQVLGITAEVATLTKSARGSGPGARSSPTGL